MSWVQHAPNGPYRNHALSTKIRREAIANTQFMKWFSPEPGYGRKKGEAVTITRVGRLPLASRVNELDSLPSIRPAIETKTVRVSQWGQKIPLTEYEEDLTHFSLPDEFRRLLREQIELTMDKMAADALKLTPIKYVPLSTGFNLDVDGTPTGTSDRNVEVQDLRRIHDYLHGTLKCPMFPDGQYRGVLSTRAARGIKNDQLYQDWFAPSTPEPLKTGKLPKNIEGFELYETNHFDALLDLVPGSLTTGEAIFFGADAGALLQIFAPEIRIGQPEELATRREIGWVGTLEAFLVWEKASLARAVHVTSAA